MSDPDACPFCGVFWHAHDALVCHFEIREENTRLREENERLRSALDVALNSGRNLCPFCSGDCEVERARIREIVTGREIP